MAKRLSVSQLNNYIKQIFQDEMLLHNIEVTGEISEFSISGNTTYITLRENGCLLQCVKFSVHEPIPIGTNVVVLGSIGFYEKGGRISFNIKTIVPTGEGKHFLRLQQLKKQLLDEGVFKLGKELPFYISKIAIVTSASGAVIHDFTRVLKDGDCSADIVLYNVKVQGEGAEKEIANAIISVDKWAKDCDCLVIMRGGGSMHDLDTFNSEELARAVATCKLPVISAVGHEIDNTLCDLCAKTRAGTPSIAAEIICSINKSAKDRFIAAIEGLKSALNMQLQRNSIRLERAENKVIKTAQLRVALCENSLSHLAFRLKQAISTLNQNSLNKTQNLANQLRSLVLALYEANRLKLDELDKNLNKNSPLRILERGYAKVFKDGKAINSVQALELGDVVDLYLQDGNALAEIKEKTKRIV